MRILTTLALVASLAAAAAAQPSPEGLDVDSFLTPVQFDTLTVADIGPAATVSVSYTARITGAATVRLAVLNESRPGLAPEVVELPRALVEGTSYTELIGVDLLPGLDYTLAWTARSAEAEAVASRHISVRHVGGDVVVVDPATLGSAADGAEARTDDGPVGTTDAGSASRTVRITGTLTSLANQNVTRVEGVYGMEVWLFFRRPGAPFVKSELVRHSGATQRGVHYDVLDEDGSFSFEFTSNDNLAPYSEVAIVPTLLGPSVRVDNSPSSSIEYYDPYTGEYENFLTPAWGGVSISIPSSGAIDVSGSGSVDLTYGPVFRYMELARDLAFEEYNGNPPFDLPTVGVEMIPGNGGGAFNYMTSGVNIYLDGGNNATVIPHEYGHYVMYNMYDRSSNRYTLRNHNFREGWALFYSLATRAYAAEAYGDVDLYSQNVEVRAYPRHSGTSLRYENVYGTDYDNAGIGALLWAWYDARSATPFEYGGPSSGFNDTLLGDNDDLSGYRRNTWEAVRTTGASIWDEAGIMEVNETFRNGLPSAVRPSVDDAYDFYLCPNFPDGCSISSLKYMPSVRPRPVTATGLQGTYSSSSTATLTWTRNTYASHELYANTPTGYRVYRNGTLVATLGASATSYQYTGGAVGTYKVAAYNAQGEAVGAPSVTVHSPLNVTVSGPTVLGFKDRGTYTANVSGGSGTTTYEWFTRWNGGATWNSTGVTTPTYSLTMGTQDVELKAEVTRGSQQAEDTIYVQYCSGSFCIGERTGGGTPQVFAVHAPSPNPADGAVSVRYDLPEAGPVTVTVFDVTGREVARPVDGWQAPGYRSASLDGRRLAPGTYLVRVQAGRDVDTHTVTVVR